jgi:hypothetical protein
VPVANCKSKVEGFSKLKGRALEVNFGGGEVSSDGGLLLVREVDRRIGLTERAASVLKDPRDPDLIVHTQLDMLRQRVYGIVQGYEDLNDHGALRVDTLLQSMLDRGEPLASAPTLCRLEKRASRQAAWALHGQLVDTFIASYAHAPKEVILDFDATDVPVHGNQEERFFHGYYDHYCFLPLYVFCGQQLLVSYLRSSKIDGAKHAWAVLALLVRRLRQAWPEVTIILRADSGFCRHHMLSWCERYGVKYCVGLARNARLQKQCEHWHEQLAAQYLKAGTKQRAIYEFRYAAKTWHTERRVITRLEYGEQGENPRYIVTNLTAPAQYLYDDLYCGRGEAENRIKEAQLGLFADRTSCHYFEANQFRLLLSSLAYVLVERLRALALSGTEFAHTQTSTLRCKLLKIGAVIVRNTRRVRVMLSSAFAYRDVFIRAVSALNTS